MPVRLLRPYANQAANTTYWGPDEDALRGTGTADDRLDLATDYQPARRFITTATANVNANSTFYVMNSTSAQTLTLGLVGYFPVGTVLTVLQLGTAATTIAPGPGVTINTALSSLVTKGQYSIGQLIKLGSGQWVAFGGFGG